MKMNEEVITETQELIKAITKRHVNTISSERIKLQAEAWVLNYWNPISQILRNDGKAQTSLSYLTETYSNSRLVSRLWAKHLRVIIRALKVSKLSNPTGKTKNSSEEGTYINKRRLRDLRKINSSKFDLRRLSQMCKEVNAAYPKNCITVIYLIRGIIDHVPPIFGCNNFTEVVNNYGGGGRSFKELMKNLNDSSRKIADTYLHIQIRKKEFLPNQTQVNFSQSLDMLLGEIIRVLS